MKQNFSAYDWGTLILVIVLLAGCAGGGAGQVVSGSPDAGQPAAQGTNTSGNSSGSSHNSKTAPNYEVVFPQDTVNRIDITLSARAWADLQKEMTAQFGAKGSGEQGSGRQAGDRQMPPGGANPQPPQGMPGDGQAGAPPQGGLPGDGNVRPGGRNNGPDGAPAQGGFPGGGMGKMDFGDTSYVSSTVTFRGETWQSVGFRYSGNSTLQTSWRSGTNKISFRLDFDEFEDSDPTTKNQRFYGFKQISFKSNAMDSSYLREKVTGDIFRAAGVIASQTAFYEVYLNYGEGSQYLGIFTAVEIVDDTLIKTQFSADSGNVYKPEGSGAAFAAGTFNEASFEKQTNQKKADWSDIQAVFTALHSDLRTTNPAQWRANLEAVFDVDAFIRWLAVDTIVQNWDTYGGMAHNYYLYTDPSDGRVTWIPWDNNMALSASMGPGAGGRAQSVRELDLASVGKQWPLIRYLIDDPVYLAQYKQDLRETIQGAFQPDKLAATYQKYHNLIAPYVERETSGATQLKSLDSFNQSVAELIQHAQGRYNAVLTYIK